MQPILMARHVQSTVKFLNNDHILDLCAMPCSINPTDSGHVFPPVNIFTCLIWLI